jgi:hypothetical protein
MGVGDLFTDHPATVGETYCGHLLRASSFGLRMLWAGSACLIHAVLPFVFVRNGSQMIAELYVEMTSRSASAAGRDSASPPEGRPAPHSGATRREEPAKHRLHIGQISH